MAVLQPQSDDAFVRRAPRQLEELKGLHVLVVDDNSTNRRVLTGLLARWGMGSTAVEDAHAALAALAQAEVEGRGFGLILLDGHMPKMDGFALAEQIQKQSSRTHAVVMMLTSAGHLGDGARCRALGISAYLVKPIRQRELLDAICQVLGTGAPALDGCRHGRICFQARPQHGSLCGDGRSAIYQTSREFSGLMSE